jgi:hypothetical protein
MRQPLFKKIDMYIHELNYTLNIFNTHLNYFKAGKRK